MPDPKEIDFAEKLAAYEKSVAELRQIIQDVRKELTEAIQAKDLSEAKPLRERLETLEKRFGETQSKLDEFRKQLESASGTGEPSPAERGRFRPPLFR